MRKIFPFFVFLSLLCVSLNLVATEDVKPTSEMLSPSVVSRGMSDVWCQKLSQCSGADAMGPKECRSVLYQSFLKGFDKPAHGQQIEVTNAAFEQCMQSIRDNDCEALKNARALLGCDFIGKLNRM